MCGGISTAVAELEADEVLKAALGDHVFTHFVQAKKEEWGEYIAQVTNWEMETYLATY